MLEKLFESYGRFCASHPLEVIVTIFTLTACVLNIEIGNGHKNEEIPLPTSCRAERCNVDDLNVADVIIMTTIRCLAILLSYYQFRNLQKLGSKYILGIAAVFTVFSSVVFTLGVANFSQSDISDFKDALFSFLLLIDLSKAAILAQLALNSKRQEEVRANIARGMSLLGPTITLDTIVETLLIGIGSLSGVKRIEVLCGFACLGVIVNYIVFMTFYPACLSLILELSRGNNAVVPLSAGKIFMIPSLKEENEKSNPVVERVKLIMIAGLFVVHANSRWPFRNDENPTKVDAQMTRKSSQIMLNHYNKTESSLNIKTYLMNWLSVSGDNIVILILLLALAVKFIFFEDKEDLNKQLRTKEKDMDVSLKTNFGVINSSPVFPLSGMGGGDWIEINNESNREFLDKEVQTDRKKQFYSDVTSDDAPSPSQDNPRSIEECLSIYKSDLGASALTDTEVIQLVKHKHIPTYQLEKAVEDMERGVSIRRKILGATGNIAKELIDLPYENYDYSKVLGSCCENVIGYMPVPVGIAGPLLIDGQFYHVPMATTEGCLVASTNRGSRALMKCGVTSRVVADGMTRGPVVRFQNIVRASEAMAWMQNPNNFQEIKSQFDLTSRFARLIRIHVRIAGRHLFIRFVAKTGDAMGMNMVSKGTEKSLHGIQSYFPDMEILSLSGNFCTDKKSAAVNWIEGRGKSVVCEALVPADVVGNVLKTSVHALVDVNISKNMIGSAIAGSIGGYNAHAANIVTAIFIATGQDPAQNVGSSNCMTLMEPWGPDGMDLYVSCTMPSIEIGTVGGGTGLPAQGACLAMLGVKGPHSEEPGENACTLARIVCATVLAGELSLMAALSAGDLVKSHLRHNRSTTTVGNTSSRSTSKSEQLVVPSVLSSLQNFCIDYPRKC